MGNEAAMEVVMYAMVVVYIAMAAIVISTEAWADPEQSARRRLLLGTFWPIVLGWRVVQGVGYLLKDVALFFKACILGGK